METLEQTENESEVESNDSQNVPLTAMLVREDFGVKLASDWNSKPNGGFYGVINKYQRAKPAIKAGVQATRYVRWECMYEGEDK